VTVLLLVGYGFLLAYLTLSPHTPHRLPDASRLQPYPFRNTIFFVHRGGRAMVVNVLGNLAAFVPLGVLWPILRNGRTSAGRIVLLAAGVSLLIESLQYLSARRIADVDDVLLNAAGGLIGYGLYWFVQRVIGSAPAVVVDE
jgi:glycopeptide antibiotics resistance protein